MTGSAIGLSFGYGFAGNVSRTPDCVIENKPVRSTSANIPFGKAVALGSDNTFVSGATLTLTIANFAGVAVAEVKQNGAFPPNNASGFYSADEPCDVIQRGIVSVKCVHGTPTAGGAVHIRTVLNPTFPTEVVGDFRADADGVFTIIAPNASWNTGLKDANNICELKLKTINN